MFFTFKNALICGISGSFFVLTGSFAADLQDKCLDDACASVYVSSEKIVAIEAWKAISATQHIGADWTPGRPKEVEAFGVLNSSGLILEEKTRFAFQETIEHLNVSYDDEEAVVSGKGLIAERE